MVKESDSTIKVGDTITVQAGGVAQEIKVVGILSDCPFSNTDGVGIIICSEDSFRQITGLSDFTVIDIQLVRGVSDSEVSSIHQMVGTQYTFSDEPIGKQQSRGALYYMLQIFLSMVFSS